MCRRAPNEITISRAIAFQKTIGGGTEWTQVKANYNDHVMWSPAFQPNTAETMAGLRYVLRHHPPSWPNEIAWNEMTIDWPATRPIVTEAMLDAPWMLSGASHCGPLLVRELGCVINEVQRATWDHDLWQHYKQYTPGLQLSDFAAGTGTYGPENTEDLDAVATVQYRVIRIRNGVEDDLTGVIATYAPFGTVLVNDPGSVWITPWAWNARDGIGFVHTFETPVEITENDQLYIDVWLQQKCKYPWSHPPLAGPAWTVPQEFFHPFLQEYTACHAMQSHGVPYFRSGVLTIRGTDCNYRVKRPLPYRLRFPDGHSWTPGNQPFLDMSKRILSYQETTTLRPGTAFPYPAVWSVPTAGNIDDAVNIGGSGDGLYATHAGAGTATQRWRLTTTDPVGSTTRIVVHVLVHCGPVSGASAITECAVALNTTSGIIVLTPADTNPAITTVPQWLSWESPSDLLEFGIPNTAAQLLLTAEGLDGLSELNVDVAYVEATYGTQWTRTESLSETLWQFSGNQDRVGLFWADETPRLTIKHGALSVTYKPANPLGYSEPWPRENGPDTTRVLEPGQWPLNEDSTWQLVERTTQNLMIFPDVVTLERL